jgi:hypothetical protein
MGRYLVNLASGALDLFSIQGLSKEAESCPYVYKDLKIN